MLKKIRFTLVAIVIILVAYVYVNKVQTVGELVDPLTYFDEFKNNTNNLVYEDTRINLKEPVIFQDEEVYVAYDFAREYVSDIIFYDEVEKVLTLTNVREVVRLYPGEINQISFSGITAAYPLIEQEGQLYLPSRLLEDFFEVKVEKGKDERLYIAHDYRQDIKEATVSKKTSLRTHPRKKSTVVEVLTKGEMITIYEEADGFLRVRSENGIIGYIPSNHIKDEKVVEGKVPVSVEEWEGNPLGEKVKLAWDQMMSVVGGNWNSSKYAHVDQLNVISPTWFEFADETGLLLDRASVDYVNTAHAKGLQVWPIISHSFTNTGLTKTILMSTQKRQYVIEQIISKAKSYGFDGINIDIENIQTDTSDVWVQFMRELYPQLKKEGIIVSVDIYMPSDWSGHYEREKVAKVTDYFIVMAYDQYWAGSDVAGSVSELGWVDEGIQRNLEEVPEEKLILGMPFYTRLWEESSDGLSSTPYGMNSAQSLITDWAVTPQLDETSGQYYAEKVEGETIYKLWLEDASSIKKRIELMEKYDLAGYGAWKLGLESADIWDILAEVE